MPSNNALASQEQSERDHVPSSRNSSTRSTAPGMMWGGAPLSRWQGAGRHDRPGGRRSAPSIGKEGKGATGVTTVVTWWIRDPAAGAPVASRKDGRIGARLPPPTTASSSMPFSSFDQGARPEANRPEVLAAADALKFRDFLTVAGRRPRKRPDSLTTGSTSTPPDVGSRAASRISAPGRPYLVKGRQRPVWGSSSS